MGGLFVWAAFAYMVYRAAKAGSEDAELATLQFSPVTPDTPQVQPVEATALPRFTWGDRVKLVIYTEAGTPREVVVNYGKKYIYYQSEFTGTYDSKLGQPPYPFVAWPKFPAKAEYTTVDAGSRLYMTPYNWEQLALAPVGDVQNQRYLTSYGTSEPTLMRVVNYETRRVFAELDE